MISKSTFPQSESFILLLRNFATKENQTEMKFSCSQIQWFFFDCTSWSYFTFILGLFRFSFPVWSLSIEFLIRIETQGKSKTNVAKILFKVQIVKPQNVMSKENIYFGYFFNRKNSWVQCFLLIFPIY